MRTQKKINRQRERIECSVIGDSNIGRIILRDNKDTFFENEEYVLEQFSNIRDVLKNKDIILDFLVFPSGFITIQRDKCNIGKYKREEGIKEEIFEKYKEEAISKVNGILKKSNIDQSVDFVIMGVDVLFNGDHNSFKNIIEFIFLIDTKKKEVIHVTGKSYPTSGGEIKTLRLGQRYFKTHFFSLRNRKLMFLACHDLNIYSNRGKANTKQEWKKIIRDRIKKLAEMEKPNIVFHVAHSSKKTTWSAPWNLLNKEIDPNIYLSSFRFEELNEGEEQHLIGKTKKGNIVNIIC